MSDKIKVGIRLKPLIQKERDEDLLTEWIVQGNSIVCSDPEAAKRGNTEFHFDYVFDSDATSDKVFDSIVKPIVNATLNGINGTVFCYGQHRSGKTYTMIGNKEEPGIIQICIKYIFKTISNTIGREFLLRVSYLEISNETVTDLLNVNGIHVKLHNDTNECTTINCKEEVSESSDNMLSILKRGNRNTTKEEINRNQWYSDHKIFRITIESREIGDTSGNAQVSQLNLVDLAGFERAHKIDDAQEQLIDVSLLAFESTIVQLDELQNVQGDAGLPKSKLMQALQPSLSGNSLIAIIFTVVPISSEETYFSLSFACQAKKVKTKPKENEVTSDNISLLSIKNGNPSIEVENVDSELQEKYRNNRLVEDCIALLHTQINSGSTSDSSEPYKCRTRRRQSGDSGTFKSHLPVYQNKSGLPTIKEMSPEKPYRKGNMQSADVKNQTFQTAFADFELDSLELDSKYKENAGSLKEEDANVTYNLPVGEFEDISGRVTPDTQDSSVQTILRNSIQESPSTPKKILRKYIFDLTKDLVELREFTTLEKQILCEEGHPGINNVDSKLLENSDLIKHKEDELYVHSSSLIVQLEDEKVKLEEKLELKNQELEEIKNDVQGLKSDIEKLQQTIFLLTNENMEMSTKLNVEKERMNEDKLSTRRTIDSLHARISQVMEEKVKLESNLVVLTDQLQSLRSQISEPRDDELLVNYQNKIDTLVTENIKLSATLAEKNEELEKVKESKSLLYDHECLHKDQLAALTEKNQTLMCENNELSLNLMDKIDENETLRNDCDVLRNKISFAEQVNTTDNDVEHLRSENHILKTEILELKMKVSMLSEENAKFSSNLFETIQDLDNSRSEKLSSSSTHSSGTFEEVSSGESREELFEKIAALQGKITHLTCLNEKLSDLKLTTCSQCAHLRNLNDSRRALKIETKILNRKVEELQKQFDQKCMDIEALKSKVTQDLNLSFADTTLNSSFADGLNVSFIEKKVDLLNTELQTMKDDNDKLTVLYQEKCDELEKLHDEVGDSKDVKPKKNVVKDESRIQKIQISIDQVRDDIDELKKNSVNFASMLNKFRTEKASLLEEINTLRSINEQLQQRVSDTEISVATATEKSHVLETELLNMNKDIEQYSEKEKEIENEKLKLEVELENKDIIINRLHKTIDDLNECVSSLKNEVDSMLSQKNELAVVKEAIEQKYSDELDVLQQKYQKLDAEKKQCLDAEIRATLWAKALEADVEKLQTELGKQESLYKEVQEKVSQLETLLEESELEKGVLKQNLQVLEKLVTDSKDNLAIQYKTEFEIIEKKFEQYTKESEIKLQKINETLSKYVDENDNLTQQLTKLRAIELKFQEMKENNEYMFLEEKTLANDIKKVKGELSTVKESMIKELKAFKHKLNSVDFLSKTANEIFIIFLQTVMAKEEEMIKTMKERFEQDKQKLEDEKRQSADAEKRATSWANELETETEKLQADLTSRESTHKQQRDKIYELERVLEENNLEKETLKEKMETLKVELNNLQNEFDKQFKVDGQREEAIIIAQKKEKELQEEHNKRETELQQKLKSQKETYEKRIEDLVHTIESCKTKNLDLKSSIEGLEANEKQLKNIIDANALELKANEETINKLGIELEQLVEAHKEVNCEVQQKTLRIEEISALLKNKCDLITEYKAKLEATLPDYKILKNQMKERKACIERYKEQMGELKMEKEKQIEMIKDKLNSEEIKNVGLNKQLHELNNKNIALVEELDTLKVKFEELQSAKAKLERKIRNSTSKIKAEAEMENLKDLNKRVQNNLEGASNRITELLDSKNKILKELIDMTSQYELLCQENAEIKMTLSSYKSRQSSPCFFLGDGKYDTLLQEKNKIALELESKKLSLIQKDIEIKEHSSHMEELSVKNKELDELLKDCTEVIREREKEISKLKDKLYLHRIENKLIKELEEKLCNLREENEKLQTSLEFFKSRPQIDTRQMDDIKLHNEKIVNALRREITELQEKVNEYENKLDQKSNSSCSRCVSPTFGISRRRHSRNKIFNEKRQIENLSDEIDIDKGDETCQILRKRIQELDLQIVAKNGQIATLELQIQSENFPYHQKCKELEERLMTYRDKNAELGSEVRKLQRTLSDVNAWECETCRKWRLNRRNQSCQTVPEIPPGILTANNGVVNDRTKITKLEKEKILLTDLCRVRNRRIRELEDKLQQPCHKSPQFDTENNLKPTVTTVPANLLDLRKPVNYRRNIWNDY